MVYSRFMISGTFFLICNMRINQFFLRIYHCFGKMCVKE